MKTDYLKWGALAAALVATASAEYELARAVGFNQWVAAAVPGALDIYTVRALRAHRDVLTAVVALIAVNAASHLVTVGLLPVDWPLVVAVAAIAPLVLWRVHSLGGDQTAVPDEQPVDELAEYAPEPEAEPVPAVPEVHPEPTNAVPEGARLLPTFECRGELQRALRNERPALVPAAEYTRSRPEVHAEYVPDEAWKADHEYLMGGDHADEQDSPAQADPLTEYGLGLAAEQFKDELLAGSVPSIRAIKERLSVGQARAKEIQDGFRQALAEWQAARTEATA
ncbi:hypothetical protein ACIF80_09645 [Streptomyces sp. NPDC085927]|uniref:hypothetical protein n=1 Tax=Streptomyces sp. NPDC085927 TaxID=3365738 RepID=UPI0037D96FE2